MQSYTSQKTQNALLNDLAAFNKILSNINWLSVYSEKDVVKLFNRVFNKYLWAVNLGLPIKKINHRPILKLKNYYNYY